MATTEDAGGSSPISTPTSKPTSAASPSAEAVGAAGAVRHLGEEVVLDTASSLVFLGRLAEADSHFFVLHDADVHDVQSGGATKERYILEARRHGIRKNRDEVCVRADAVVSLSRLADVTLY